MSELDNKAQLELSKILDACKDKAIYSELKSVVDLLIKHTGVIGEAQKTIEESELERVQKAKKKELEGKGAFFVLEIGGKYACFGEMGMQKFLMFANELGEDGFEKFSAGKATLKLIPALTKMYDELLLKDISDEVFFEDGEYTAQAILALSDHIAMGKKKVVRL